MTRLVEDPVLKQRYEFRRDGDVLVVEAWVDPGGGVTPHVHPGMEEHFTVLDGEIEFLVGRKWVRTADVLVPAGTRHAYRNRGTQTAHMVTKVTPALELEAFLTDIAGLAQRRRFTRRGLPTSIGAIPELAAVAQRYRETVVLETPLRPLIPLLARSHRGTTPAATM
ncbi:MAG TPA: cupin domain-containing protein [Solirubrobacteraceae bacterium]|nr:cupin domain-containing protein [Solirubrobacteraceae bacterium]